MFASAALALRRQNVLPGFPLSLGIALPFLLLFVVLPIASMLGYVLALDPGRIWASLQSERLQAALALSFGAALVAALIATPIGLLLAWVLARYEFWGRRVIDALIDVPFALPTAVTGIALAYLYGPQGYLGALLADWGIHLAFQRGGIVLALVFVSLPFVVRTVQPVIEALVPERAEAAATLGAGPWTIFRRVQLPELRTALATGFALSFARGVGEYGSVIFIAGNRPFRTEVAPLLIITRLEEFDYVGAFAVATAMLVFSMVVLLWMSRLQRSRLAEVQRG